MRLQRLEKLPRPADIELRVSGIGPVRHDEDVVLEIA
jgi:hypothetical protein